MKQIDFVFLKRINEDGVRISDKHATIIQRLRGMGYLLYENGNWVVTPEGEAAILEWEENNVD